MTIAFKKPIVDRYRVMRTWSRRRPGVPWWAIYSAGSLVSAAVLLLNGSNAICVFLALCAVLVSLVPAWLYGWRDMPSLVCLLVGARYATSAMVWKLLSWGTLDDGLYAPEASFLVVFLGICSVTLAAIVARALWRKSPLLQERYSSVSLQFLLFVGMVCTLGGTLIGFSRIEILGGISALVGRGFILLPLAWIALNIRRGRTPITLGFAIFLTVFSLGLLSFNSRLGLASSFIAITAYLICYKIKVSKTAISLATLAACFFVFVVAPAMTDVRGDRDQLTPTELVGATVMQFGKRISGDVSDKRSEFDSYFLRYTTGANNFVERAVNVQQLDFVVALTQNHGTIGLDRFQKSLFQLLPSIFVSNKDVITSPSYVFWVAGTFDWGQERQIETTAFGDAYVMGGYPFVIFALFIVFLLIFLIFRFFCPVFEKSLLASFFISSYIHFFTASTVIGLISMLIREMPFEILLFSLASNVRPRRIQSWSTYPKQFARYNSTSIHSK